MDDAGHFDAGNEGRLRPELIAAARHQQVGEADACRVDFEDLPSIYFGRIMTHLILDNEEHFTPRQRETVRLYYREGLVQEEIGRRMGVSHQAVAEQLAAVRARVWKVFGKSRAYGELEELGLVDLEGTPAA